MGIKNPNANNNIDKMIIIGRLTLGLKRKAIRIPHNRSKGKPVRE
jgi:hypothetical protein